MPAAYSKSLNKSSFTADAVSLAFIDAGEGPLIILLHGFPDTAETWARTQYTLAENGYRSVALHMRGYPPSDVPADGDYSIRRLAKDALALMEYCGAQRAAIVGHDWGAMAAYAAAAIAPERLSCVVALAIPPFMVFGGGLRERLARPHNLYLAMGGIAAWWLKLATFQEVDRLYRRWSPSWAVPESHLSTVKTALRQPMRTRAAVDYYAAALSQQDAELFAKPITVPTMIIYGADEPKVRQEMFARSGQAIGAEYEIIELPRTGHWPHLENPEVFERALLAFLVRALC
jgi:pimeloyl-ACP methyl ester carboxylesterase